MKNLRSCINRNCINWLNREQITELLENNGMAVYDSETTDELEDTLFECIESGDIEEQTIRDLVG